MDTSEITPADTAPAAAAATAGFKVAKPFNTHNRRLKPGDTVEPSDLVRSGLDFEHMRTHDFIVAA